MDNLSVLLQEVTRRNEGIGDNLDEWNNEQESRIVDFKIDIYVVPNSKIKICPKCGNKTVREILSITNNIDYKYINRLLFTRRCEKCEITYMANSIFKSYADSRAIENINVNFIFEKY